MIPDAIAELLTARDTLDPQIEGLRDFAALNLKPDTQQAVQKLRDAYARRRERLASALEALEALQNDGYPDVETLDVPATVLADLEQNVTTIQAAFKQFHAENEAVTGTIEFDRP